MSLDNKPTYSGGCQCGAVRFHVEGPLGDASICHCRMCQKAFGAFYAPPVSARGAKLTWTRGEPKRFQSSNFVMRGFCADCGTQLFSEAEQRPHLIIVRNGALDDTGLMAPGATIWTSQAPEWAWIDATLPRHAGQPPPVA